MNDYWTKQKVVIFEYVQQDMGKSCYVTLKEFTKILFYSQAIPYTCQEYYALPKEKKDKIKNSYCYILGDTYGNKRDKASVISRWAITLDIEHTGLNYDDMLDLFKDKSKEIGVFLAYETINSHPDDPRFRVIIPLEQNLSPLKYEQAAQIMMSYFGYDYCDKTTYMACRVMFLPIAKKDKEIKILRYNYGEPFTTMKQIALLKEKYYSVPPEDEIKAYIKPNANIQLSKPFKTNNQLQNQFNETFTIDTVIDAYLTHIYEKDYNKRYTYLAGNGKGGLVCLDDWTAYSHDETDPANRGRGIPIDAYTLLLIHKFNNDLLELNKFVYKLLKNTTK